MLHTVRRSKLMISLHTLDIKTIKNYIKKTKIIVKHFERKKSFQF